MLLDEQLFIENANPEYDVDKTLTYDEKIKYLKEYPTYYSDTTKYYTRPCKIWDLNLTPEQEAVWDDFMVVGELGNFWNENAELADHIYQDGRMGGHLIFDDEDAMPDDWTEFSTFDDVLEAELDEYSYYQDEPIAPSEYAQAKESAEHKIDLAYNKLKSFDERVDKLIELLKNSLDNFAASNNSDDIDESLGDYDSAIDNDVQKEIDAIFKSSEKSFPYQMLDRLKSDCKYILGSVKEESEDHKVPLDIINKFLWFHDIDKQIALMKGIYDRLEEKPEWISLEDIDNFERELKEVVREHEQFSEDFAIRERTTDELKHMIDYYTKAIEKYKEANDLEDAEWCQKQLEWAKHELSKKDNIEENLNENRHRKLTYDKLYDMLEDAGYHLFASTEYDNALALAKKEEASLQAAKDICDKNGIEYIVKFYKPTERFHMTILLPDDMLEEELSRNNVIDLAKKHNVDLKFTDEKKSGSFLVNGDPKDMSEFFDDYKKSYVEAETKTEEVKNESLNEELSETTLKNTALKNILSALIQDELQAIDSYNSAIVTFESESASQFTDIFRDIISEENKHIGQLQAALGEIDPQDVSDIEAGQSEGEGQIQTELSPEDVTEVEVTEKSE